ncbi:MAG: TraR/DksA family transcriptional regulator [Nitrospira defluvii]|nr:TraR/DksA family transcriptional regulator [Nitrospira defluvii]
MLPLDKFREKLLAARRDMFQQAARTEDDLLWLETDVESEVEERGQEEGMKQFLDRLDTHLKSEIEAVDKALAKIGAGRYGHCEACGHEIPASRLEALPAAAWCLPCAQAREAHEARRK